MKNNDSYEAPSSKVASSNTKSYPSLDKGEGVGGATTRTSTEESQPPIQRKPVSTDSQRLQLVRTFAPNDGKQLNALRLLADASPTENQSDQSSLY